MGKEYRDTLISAYWLADVLFRQERYKEAEIVYRRIFETWQKTSGMEYEDTLLSAYWLALSLYELGKYQEAEAMYRQTVEGMEKLFGKEHLITLHCVNDLGWLLGQLK